MLLRNVTLLLVRKDTVVQIMPVLAHAAILLSFKDNPRFDSCPRPQPRIQASDEERLKLCQDILHNPFDDRLL